MRKSNNIAYLLLILAPMFWAGNFVIGRFIHGSIPPFTLAFFRWLVVIMILLPLEFTALKKHMLQIRQHFFSLVILSLLSVVVYNGFIYWGLHNTTAVNASLVNAAVPLLILIFASTMLGETISIKKILGMALSFIGVVYVITQGHISTLWQLGLSSGDFIIFIAVIAWALFSVLTKKMQLSVPPFLFLLITAIMGDIMLFPCFLWEHYHSYPVQYNGSTFFSIMYAAVFSSIAACSFWNIGIRKVGPATSAYFFNLLPIFSSVLAIVFLGEKIHVYHITGFIIVVSGIWLATGKRFKNIKQKPYDISKGLRNA